MLHAFLFMKNTFCEIELHGGQLCIKKTLFSWVTNANPQLNRISDTEFLIFEMFG